MIKIKRIPFDINEAQAGAKIITRDGRLVKRLDYCFEFKGDSHPIKAYVQGENGLTTYGFTKNGKFNIHEEIESPNDLFIEKEVKTRRMTNQELSWWLREHPEEHREYHLEGETCICFNYHYNSGNSNKEVDEYIRIRKNGGEWVIPIIEM